MIEQVETEINEDNLLLKILTRPTDTLIYILNNSPQKYVTILLVLGGIMRVIERASARNLGDTTSTLAILTIAVVIGGSLGWITYYIYAWGMSATGNWIGGTAEPDRFRTIIAWALIPSLGSLVLLFPEIFIFKEDLFKSVPVNTSMFNNIMWFVFGMSEFILGIWSLIILVKGIIIIQNFKVGKAILNLFLPGLIIISVILFIVLLIYVMK